MTRGFFISMLIAGFLGLGAIVLASQSTFLFKHPKTMGVRVVIGENGGAIVDPDYLNPAAAKSPHAPKLPRARIPESTYNFGVMNPLTEGVHEFLIYNVGTAPLLVDIESTTCKCTVGGVSKKEVEPGGKTKVTLQWNTGRNLFFTHGAVVRTNDAFNRKLELVVDGKVKMLVGSDVKELIVPNIEPGKDQDAEFLLYSQLWDEMDVTRITCGIQDLRWIVTAVPAADAPDLAATVVRRVRVTVPGTLASGSFADSLRVYVQRTLPADAASNELTASEPSIEKEQFELSMHGTVLRRFALFGPTVRGDGVIDLGEIKQGRSKKFVIRGKIRDSDRSLGETTVQATPDFLRASLAERTSEEGVTGLYELTLEIPAEAPDCQFLGTPEGEVVVKTEHPRLGELRYRVHFVIRP